MKEPRHPDFELTAPERELLSTIKLDQRMLNGYEDETRNGNAVCALIKSFMTRHAIPAPRLKYFLDPNYNPGGRGKSRKQFFERNGCMGDDILRHPHFLEYLRYFLFGADLPEPVIWEFRSTVSRYSEITSKSTASLKRFARNLAGTYSLDAYEAGEEFYKLALDCGIKHTYADDIRRAVRKMR